MNKVILNKLTKIADRTEAFALEIEALQQKAEDVYDRECDKDAPNDDKIEEYANVISDLTDINDALNDSITTIRDIIDD